MDEDLLKGWQCISSQEGSNGIGVKIYVKVPQDRSLTEIDANEVQHVGYTLYNELQGRLHKSHPEEIEATAEERQKILALFGDQSIFVEEIPSGYDKQYGRPWFVVTTKIGRIKIGWRKRVMNIDWSETVVKIKAEDLFKEENTTKGSGSEQYYYYIHAWSYEKAKEYLDKLFASQIK